MKRSLSILLVERTMRYAFFSPLDALISFRIVPASRISLTIVCSRGSANQTLVFSLTFVTSHVTKERKSKNNSFGEVQMRFSY